jgi:hypothetical protein
MTQVKFIRMVDRVVIEKGETNEGGFAEMQRAHPGEYRIDVDDKPVAPIKRIHDMFEKRVKGVKTNARRKGK